VSKEEIKTYGTLKYHHGSWIIECDPHVLLRMRRVFPRMSKPRYQAGKTREIICIMDTPEVSRDIEWFQSRFPFDYVDKESEIRLARRANEHREAEFAVHQIIGDPARKPQEFKLALPPRDYQKVAAELALRTGGVLIGDQMGLGKAQPLDAVVLTPYGWRKMGELAVGDEISDPDGGTAFVEAIFPQGDRPVFRVTTADGASAECCDEHLWTVHTAQDRYTGKSRTLPLSEIRKSLNTDMGKGRVNSKYFLPISKPVTFAPAPPLPIPAYLLGVLLGDGHLKQAGVAISSADQEILDHVISALPPGLWLHPVCGSNFDYNITSGNRGGQKNALIEALRALGLAGKRSWEKTIPHEYLCAAVSDRLALLKGLMDTDGTCGTSGTVTFTSTSLPLAEGVQDLVGTLGGFASLYSRHTNYEHLGERRQGRLSYTVHIRIPICPFALKRKAERWRMPLMARAIKTVEPAGIKPVQCIRVSSKRHLYLTDGYLATHNTISAACALTDPRTRPALVVTKTALPSQWQAELRKFLPRMSTHILRGTRPYDIAKQCGGVLPDVIITSYSKIPGWGDYLSGNEKLAGQAQLVKLGSVVYDEVHEFRNGEDTNKGKAAMKISRRVQFRIGLSGTPFLNLGGELWNVMEFIRPGALGLLSEFKQEHCTGDADKPGKLKLKSPEAMGSYLRDSGLMIRRTKEDVGRQLPALTRIPHYIDFDQKVLDAVDGQATALARTILAKGEMSKGARMQAAGKLDNLLRQSTGLAKAPYVAEFLRMLVEGGESVVCFAWHHAVYDVLRDKLKDFAPAFYTGLESVKEKEESKRRFIAGETKILIMSLRSGEGLDGLQHVCNNVVSAELDYSPGIHEQNDTRIHRDGQLLPVFSYFLLADEGSDPVISDILGIKRAQLEGVRDLKVGNDLPQEVDLDRMKKIAQAYLDKKSIRRSA
jgi:hypothetical protein